MTAKRLRAKALDLLSRRNHSEKELEEKLRSRGGEESDVAQVIKDLRDIGLLDDKRFAENFLACRTAKAWGRRRYRQELQSRGIDKEISEAALSQEFDAGTDGQDLKLRGLIERELSKGRDKQKVIASMLRRGFDFREVMQAFSGIDKAESDF